MRRCGRAPRQCEVNGTAGFALGRCPPAPRRRGGIVAPLRQAQRPHRDVGRARQPGEPADPIVSSSVGNQHAGRREKLSGCFPRLLEREAEPVNPVAARGFRRVRVGLPREAMRRLSPAGQARAQRLGPGETASPPPRKGTSDTIDARGPAEPAQGKCTDLARRFGAQGPVGCEAARSRRGSPQRFHARNLPAPHARPPARGRRSCEQASIRLTRCEEVRKLRREAVIVERTGMLGWTSTSAAARSPGSAARGTQPRFRAQSPSCSSRPRRSRPIPAGLHEHDSRVTLPPQSRQRNIEPPHVGDVRRVNRPARVDHDVIVGTNPELGADLFARGFRRHEGLVEAWPLQLPLGLSVGASSSKRLDHHGDTRRRSTGSPGPGLVHAPEQLP